MNRLQELLREADPVTREMPLGHPDVERLRDRLLAEVASPAAVSRRTWLTPWYAAVLGAACLAMVVFVGRSTRDGGSSTAASNAAQVALESVGPPRQLHFSTPGGTRVIWVFDPDFEERR